MTAVPVDMGRLSAEIEELARISDDPYPSVTRVLFTPTDMAGRAWLAERLRAAGLTIRTDPMGNAFARLEGTDPRLPAVATGSHTDAIPGAGRFDGVVGVLGGLEALRAIRAAGVASRRSIELIVFTAEEPTRFGIGCLGSRVMAGTLDAAALAALRDAEGVTLDAARATAGLTGDAAAARLPEGAYHAFVELHIEQGPELEARGLDIGVVTAIAAPATLRVELTGEGGHAGALLMPLRHDPLVVAAGVVQEVDRVARGTGHPDSVATVGLLRVEPGAVNSVPRRVVMEIDVRDTDEARRDGMLDRIRASGAALAAERGVGHADAVVNRDRPCTSAPEVVGAVEAACGEVGASHHRMVSRAYHDALFMARICRTGMVFVPSRGGVSHRPDEFTETSQIARGVEVLAGALVRLAS